MYGIEIFDKGIHPFEGSNTPIKIKINGHEFEQTLGDRERWRSLVCCSPWGCKESDTNWQLNNNNSNQDTTFPPCFVITLFRQLHSVGHFLLVCCLPPPLKWKLLETRDLLCCLRCCIPNGQNILLCGTEWN